jgi:nucleotidyltransferase substrate binding protein (TIGR01987 family)
MNAGTERKIENLRNAISRLREALAREGDDPLLVDGTIQRFEFVFELFWKTLRVTLAAEGIEANTPRECLKKAFAARWLGDEEAWLGMLAARNETSHVYCETAAQRIFGEIRLYFPEIERAFAVIEARAKEG